MGIAVKCFLFFLSSAGWWEVLRKYASMDTCFLPSMTVAIQVVLLFLAGILNLLMPAAWGIYVLGLLVFLFFCWQNRGFLFLRAYATIDFGFFAFSLLVMALVVRGKLFWHYDNFSHWAIVVQEMLITNRFPNFLDEVILFTNYPLGSASFLYYFSKTVLNSEPAQMFAQVYMMLACIMPLFVFARKNRLFSALVILFASNLFLVYNIPVTELLVDTLLPLSGMCSVVYVYTCCGKDGRSLSVLLSAFYTVQLILIKNSGIFFVAILCLWIICNQSRDQLWIRLGSIFAPFVALVLWNQHCRYVFANSSYSKHALTWNNLFTGFRSKSLDSIRTISLSLFRFAFSWTDFWATVCVFLILGILTALFARGKLRFFKNASLFSLAFYIAFQLGLLAMYIFSMPEQEALALAGHTRYAKSAVIAMLYLAAACAVTLVSSMDPKKPFAAGGLSMILSGVFCLFLLISAGKLSFLLPYYTTPTRRLWLESAQEEYQVPDGQSYAILLPPEEDTEHTFFLCKYLFHSTHIFPLIVKDAGELDALDVQYIFNYDTQNEQVAQWIRQNYPEQEGEKVIVCRPDA